MDQNAKFSMQFSAKQVFWAGVATGVLGILALCAVLVMSKNVDMGSWFNGSARVGAPAPQAPSVGAPTDAAPAGDQVGTVAPVTDKDHIRGDKNAPVTFIEYSDFQCPYCAKFHPTMQQIMREYSGKVRWVYRHFPLSFHPYAQKSAEASECASEQGKFWEMVDTFFAAQDQWSQTGLDTTTLENLAKQAGVRDMKKFNDCVASGKYAALVQAHEQSGTEAGVTGTPNSILLGANGSKRLIPGGFAIDVIRQMIDSALQN